MTDKELALVEHLEQTQPLLIWAADMANTASEHDLHKMFMDQCQRNAECIRKAREAE